MLSPSETAKKKKKKFHTAWQWPGAAVWHHERDNGVLHLPQWSEREGRFSFTQSKHTLRVVTKCFRDPELESIYFTFKPFMSELTCIRAAVTLHRAVKSDVTLSKSEYWQIYESLCTQVWLLA